MSIHVAESAGFCFGVNRAVELVEQAAKSGKKVCTLGPIIHNPQLVKELEDRGVRIVESPNEVQEGETLVIRSHGVAASVFEEAKQKNLKIADATCPFVSKIHRIVAEKGHFLTKRH